MQTQAITQKATRFDLTKIQPQLDYMLELARAARMADINGDQELAAELRTKHDRLYQELLRKIP